jgi:cysteinyl-tRNA synthetase, unknown class
MTLTIALLVAIALIALCVLAVRLIAAELARGNAQSPPPAAAGPLPKSQPHPTSPAPHGTTVRTWGYQLQKLNVAAAAASPFDLLVIDPAKDGSDDSALSSSEIARLKQKPDGSRRLLLAYLSIGEAESYRSYWDPKWKRQHPEWLLAENPEWKENYAVCYWAPEWQDIMCGNPDARLDRIIAAGFDGVYLDKCDVFDDMRRRRLVPAKARPNLEGDMIAFVERLSRHAKQTAPGFLVIMQNAEDLLSEARLRAALDGVAKEELVFGIDGPEKRNDAENLAHSSTQLDLIKREGKLVLVVEYLNTQKKIDDAVAAIAPKGYALYIAPKDRALDRLNVETHIA